MRLICKGQKHFDIFHRDLVRKLISEGCSPFKTAC